MRLSTFRRTRIRIRQIGPLTMGRFTKRICRALRQVAGKWFAGKADILGWQVDRARYVEPIHPLGWGNQLPRVRLADGLAYLSTAQIHPWPVFNDEAVGNVDSHLEEILGIIG